MPEEKREGYFIGVMDDENVDLAIKLTQQKRKTTKANCDYKAKNFKNLLKAADKMNARYCCVMGSNEIQTQTIVVKDLETKTEEVVKLEDF